MRTVALFALLLAFAAPPRVVAQANLEEDGLVAYPNVYRVQFENEFVRLVRVTIPSGSRLGNHTHPAGLTLYIYLNDADPITFVHTSAAGTIQRPPVMARSYRTVRNGFETHALFNIGRTATDFLRVEFKTQGAGSGFPRIKAPPMGGATTATVELKDAQFTTTRITVAPRDQFVVTADTPALLVAMTDGEMIDGTAQSLGEARFLAAGQKATIRARGSEPVQLLRIDFLTRP